MNAVTPEAIMSQARREVASQATSIEQSRAIAEVQAAVTIAQKFPRNISEALIRVKESCGMMEVAEAAFFKLPRGGTPVTGETIHLATELANCWGNIAYGVMELSRDDVKRESEMLAFAWDMERNTRPSMTFIVPHVRDTKNGAKPLVDMRDIYENNANMGARRLRECIFRVLPAYLKEAAKKACYETLEKGISEKPLTVNIAEAIKAFDDIGISKARLEGKFGPSANWTAPDVVQLKVSYRSISRREISADEEFPRVGLEETTNAAKSLAIEAKSNDGTLSEENPAATEGRDDSQMGEAHSDDDPRAKVADEIVNALNKVGSAKELADLLALRANDIAALPEDLAADVEIARRDAEARISGGNA